MDGSAEVILGLQKRIEIAHQKEAKAEAVRDEAFNRLSGALQKLKDSFGVDSITQATARLKEMEREVAELVTSISNDLDEVENS